jgi:hypothetical protein
MILSDEDYELLIKKSIKAHHFLSKQFNHTLITKLFEGWEYEGKYEDTHYDTVYHTYIFKKDTNLGFSQYKKQRYKIVYNGVYALYATDRGLPSHSRPKNVDDVRQGQGDC